METTWLTILKKLLELIITPKNKCLLTTTSGLLLFTPKQYLAQLGLTGIATNHQTAAGLIFCICTCSLLIDLCAWLRQHLLKTTRQRTETRRTQHALQTLTDQQKETLSPLTTKGITRGFLPCDPESTQRMVDSGILIPQSPRFYSDGYLREYSLSPIARQHFYGKD